MKLPLKDFVDVVHGLNERKNQLHQTEGRDAARIEVSAKVTLQLLRNHAVCGTLNVLTSEISLGGLGVVQSVALPVGTQVIVALPYKDKGLSVHATVSRCAELAYGVYAVGLDFTQLVEREPASDVGK
jgi:hypothetical protein